MTWTFTAAADFARHANAWGALNRRLGDNPALDPDFVAPLLQTFGTGAEIIAVEEVNAEVRAMTILTRTRGRAWQTFQPSQAPLGLWLADPQVPLASYLDTLLPALPGFPLLLGVTQLDPEIFARPANAGRVRTLDYIRTARITVAGSFEDYWAKRGKNLRHNIRRQLNRLERERISARLEVETDADALDQAIADYGRLESAGWKSGEGTAVHPDNPQGQYYRAMLERFTRRGAGRIYRYWLQNQLAAVDLCVEQNGTLIILKTTYDERITNFSPAFLMRHEAFRQIFSEGKIRRIEFYGKLMDWHTKWTDEVRTLYHTNWYRWSLLARLRG